MAWAKGRSWRIAEAGPRVRFSFEAGSGSLEEWHSYSTPFCGVALSAVWAGPAITQLEDFLPGDRDDAAAARDAPRTR